MLTYRAVEKVIPAEILEAHPPEERDIGVASYLSTIAHLPPFFEAIKHANLDELCDFVVDYQFGMHDLGVSQLQSIADHPACDFALAMEVMLYAEPSYWAQQDPSTLSESYERPAYEMVRGIAERLNEGAYAFSPADAKTNQQKLDAFQDELPEGWRLSSEMYEAASAHAERQRVAAAQKPKGRISFDEALEMVQRNTKRILEMSKRQNRDQDDDN